MRSKPTFLIDIGVGRVVEDWLAKAGYDVLTVREINPRMPDKDILSLADQEKRMVITMDKDFGELVHHASKSHAGVLLLRMEDATSFEKMTVISQLMRDYEEKLVGHFCVYQRGKLRIR